MRTRLLFLLGTTLCAVGCGSSAPSAAKLPVHDTFSRVGDAQAAIARLDERTPAAMLRTHGDYGWLKLEGRAGETLDVWIRSSDGDAVGFLLDEHDDVVASADDAAPGVTDAHLTVALTASGTYYLAVREYSYSPAHLRVELARRATKAYV
jgi:hypothetical protein